MNKQNLTQLVEQLPEIFSLEEVLDRIILLSKIEAGLEQSDKDEVLSTEELKLKLAKGYK